MDTNAIKLLEEISTKTNNDIIILLIALGVLVSVLAVAIIPLYRENGKRRKDETEAVSKRQDKYIEREEKILNMLTAIMSDNQKVVAANTEAITGLKLTLELSSKSTNSSLTRIHERIDLQSSDLTVIKEKLDSLLSR